MKIIRNLLLVLTLLFLASCKEDTFMKDYPQLEDKKHIYELVEIDKVLSIFHEKETAVILMGFPACPWCQAVVPFVNEIAKEENVDTVYYLDILEMRDESSLNHNKYLELKTLIIDAVDKEKDRINGPTLVIVKDGQMVGYHLDTVSSHQIENGVLPPLTEEQKIELRDILRNLIKRSH